MANHGVPQSRNEAILQNILGEENEILEPMSRIETLLIEILEQGQSGGTNYSEDEHEVGTWIDGSTLYEKTFVANIADSSGNETTISLANLGINNIFSVEAILIDKTKQAMGLGVVQAENAIVAALNVFYAGGSNEMYVEITNVDVFEYPLTVYVTIRYTKEV